MASFANTYFAQFLHTQFASIDSFWGLPDRGNFVTKSVRRNFQMMRVVKPGNPSRFNAFSISAGWRPCLWRILITCKITCKNHVSCLRKLKLFCGIDQACFLPWTLYQQSRNNLHVSENIDYSTCESKCANKAGTICKLAKVLTTPLLKVRVPTKQKQSAC